MISDSPKLVVLLDDNTKVAGSCSGRRMQCRATRLRTLATRTYANTARYLARGADASVGSVNWARLSHFHSSRAAPHTDSADQFGVGFCPFG